MFSPGFCCMNTAWYQPLLYSVSKGFSYLLFLIPALLSWHSPSDLPLNRHLGWNIHMSAFGLNLTFSCNFALFFFFFLKHLSPTSLFKLIVTPWSSLMSFIYLFFHLFVVRVCFYPFVLTVNQPIRKSLVLPIMLLSVPRSRRLIMCAVLFTHLDDDGDSSEVFFFPVALPLQQWEAPSLSTPRYSPLSHQTDSDAP